MTTTPAMPELPEPRTLSRGDEDGHIQLGYTADQMRAYALATLQAQPAEVSDAEIERVWYACGVGTDYDVPPSEDDMRFARAILALRPQSYPLPDGLYDSKDWRQGNYASRVEWLHTMYEHAKHERDEYAAQLEALRPQAAPMTQEQKRNRAIAESAVEVLCPRCEMKVISNCGSISGKCPIPNIYEHGITAPAGGEG